MVRAHSGMVSEQRCPKHHMKGSMMRDEGAKITKSLPCPEKEGTFYHLIRKGPVENVKHMEMRASSLQVRRMTLVSCEGRITEGLGWRQEGQRSIFSDFEVREAETSGM